MNKFEHQIITEIYSDEKGHRRKNTINMVMYDLNDFTKEELEELTKNGNKKIYSQIDWAISHLKEQGYSEISERGVHVITDKGKRYLQKNKHLSKDKSKQEKITNSTNISDLMLNQLKKC